MWEEVSIPEMGFPTGAPRHGFMVGMEMRVVVNHKLGGGEGGGDLAG